MAENLFFGKPRLAGGVSIGFQLYQQFPVPRGDYFSEWVDSGIEAVARGPLSFLSTPTGYMDERNAISGDRYGRNTRHQ